MTPELSTTLASLAQKLGVSVEYLWPKLVAHARASAITSAVVGALAITVAIFILKSVHKNMVGDTYDDDMGPIMIAVFAVIALLAATLMVSSSIPDALFPEAAALHSLLHG